MSRALALSHFLKLLESCRVRVKGLTEGAGFFVAPGWVVSCAHVTGADVGREVPVAWGDTALTGIVKAASAAPGRGRGIWPFPDLAFIEIRNAPSGHPCVWLDNTTPPRDTPLTAVGFSTINDPDVPQVRTAELKRGGQTYILEGMAWELIDGEINLGLSGGPVLSHESGGVCAVVKATRKKDSSMGGYGVPMDAFRMLDADVYRAVLRAHDRFHAEDDRWTKLSEATAATESADQVARTLTRKERRELLAILADLDATPETLQAAFIAAADPGAGLPAVPLVDSRDVVTELASQMPPETGLPYELRFAAHLVARTDIPAINEELRQRLRDYLLITSGRLGLGELAKSQLTAVGEESMTQAIIVGLRHSLRDRKLFHVTAWRYYSPTRIVPAGDESVALPLAQAVTLLKTWLPEQIAIMGGVSRPGLIELILPIEAIDGEYQNWKLWPGQEWFALGRKQLVVVRPQERHKQRDLHSAWVERWEKLNSKDIGEALTCVCGRDDQQAAALGAAFDTDSSLLALVLAGSPRSGPVSDAYRVAVASGIPMMIWRREAPLCARPQGRPACGIPGEHRCPGDGFFTALRSAMSATQRDRVPEKVRQLRNEAVKDGSDHVGNELVILWDDPHRQIPLTPYVQARKGSA